MCKDYCTKCVYHCMNSFFFQPPLNKPKIHFRFVHCGWANIKLDYTMSRNDMPLETVKVLEQCG